jgi:hypothetical protein
MTDDDPNEANAMMLMPRTPVNKLAWAQVGRVTEPGRYMYTFGWLTITTEDLAVWRTYPTARFTLLSKGFSESAEEYRLGSFDPGGYGMNEAAA